MADEVSPTARALLALEMIQNSPGITAQRLGERLGVTERAARRYVTILHEADLPIESVSGPHGGYRVGRGLRLPPLMFSAAEAMGIVMAVLEGHRGAANPADLVGSALAKIVRVLPDRVAGPVRAFREVTAAPSSPGTWASPELTTQLIESCTAGRRLRLTYRMGAGRDRVMEVDPWALARSLGPLEARRYPPAGDHRQPGLVRPAARRRRGALPGHRLTRTPARDGGTRPRAGTVRRRRAAGVTPAPETARNPSVPAVESGRTRTSGWQKMNTDSRRT